MNRQELLRQADYNFQRGNRALAGRYLNELLASHPNDESAWMLLARVEQEKERRIECYEHALRINPKSNEARIGLIRLRSISPTLPSQGGSIENPWQAAGPAGKTLRGIVLVAVILLGLGTTTFVIAKANPGSRVAQLIIPPTPTPFVESLSDDIAAQTRAQVGADYPQYASLVDGLIGLAVKNAESGMDGAPERPGAEIIPFEGAGVEARTKLLEALPQTGSLSSLTLDEEQFTSWLVMELKNSPDLPLGDLQVYLRDDRIQIWGMVTGSTNSTSALIVGTLSPDLNGRPAVEIESIQIGQQTVPDILLSQGEAWLNQLISEEINQLAPGLEIMNININDGRITISGMR